MIWHRGKLYMYDGWTVSQEWYGPVTLRPAGRFPGYVRLVDFATGKVHNFRADTVMIGSDPV
jgi:hypothetical protein